MTGNDMRQQHRIAYGNSGSKQIDLHLVTSALEKLGTERVARAHVALEHSKAGDWNACFFSMAFGPYGELNRWLARNGDEQYNVANLFRRAYGIRLTQKEVWAVVEAFDHSRDRMQLCVEEWLELNVEHSGARTGSELVTV